MKKLCELIGGSHLYGLSTPESDTDYRSVFIHDDLPRTIGLDRFEHLDIRNKEQDDFGFEVRHFFNLLRKTNTQVVEILFAKEFIILDPEFKRLVIDQKERFLNSERFYKSLKGYIHGERRLANGERTGELGGKRKEALLNYGFSPKNFVQLIRLTTCGIAFFRNGVYPVNIKNHNSNLWENLMQLKTQPQGYNVRELNLWVNQLEEELNDAFESRDKSKDFVFDEQYANQVLLMLYKPIVDTLHAKYKI